MTPEEALDRAFSFTLDMVANTQGQIPPAIAMMTALDQFGYTLTEKEPEPVGPAPGFITVHACRADRDCNVCGARAGDYLKEA